MKRYEIVFKTAQENGTRIILVQDNQDDTHALEILWNSLKKSDSEKKPYRHARIKELPAAKRCPSTGQLSMIFSDHSESQYDGQ